MRLTRHHCWQGVHDKLHQLDSFKETNQFEKKLNRFRETWLVKLLDLVDKELADEAGGAVTGKDALGGVSRRTPSPGSKDSGQAYDDALADDLRTLKTWLEAPAAGPQRGRLRRDAQALR